MNINDPSDGSVARSTDKVETLRRQQSASIEHQCGSVRVLDLPRPRNLNPIYTSIKLLPKLSGRQRKAIEEIENTSILPGGDRSPLSQIQGTGIVGRQAVERHSKLIVLGKPGAGKTTFLKHIALECSSGNLFPEYLPVFLSLRHFAEAESRPSLETYLSWQLGTEDIAEPQVVKQVLQQGKFLLLFDGLDEVPQAESKRICLAIARLTARYPDNRYTIACRLGAQEYIFEQFTAVEIADFDREQIEIFARQWFNSKDSDKSRIFLEKLQVNPAIADLATNPLLLTVWCGIFEQSQDFPSSHWQLLQAGANIMLETWDATRYIEREQVAQPLSRQHKQELLEQIAFASLCRGQYLFRQQELIDQIAEYLHRFPEIQLKMATARLEFAKSVLKSIEAQHGLLVERAKGIYAFSHLSFQEYFAARAIASVEIGDRPQSQSKTSISQEKDNVWRKVLLLAKEIVAHGDRLALQLEE